MAVIAHAMAGCGHLIAPWADLHAPVSGGGATREVNGSMPPAEVLVEADEEVTVAELAVHHAMTMIGRQYRRRSAGPNGFDASGLVHYSFAKAGSAIPRQHERQRAVSGRIFVANLRLGDLVYFDVDGKKHSHVGIYIGDGRFVHASPSFRRVRMERIDTPYWQQLLSEARRPDARRGLMIAR